MKNYEDIHWRLKLYKLMLEHIKEIGSSYLWFGYGLCYLVSWVLIEYELDNNDEYAYDDNELGEALVLLPELHLQKPKKLYSRIYWWKPGNITPRKRALNKAIKLAESKIANKGGQS